MSLNNSPVLLMKSLNVLYLLVDPFAWKGGTVITTCMYLDTLSEYFNSFKLSIDIILTHFG